LNLRQKTLLTLSSALLAFPIALSAQEQPTAAELVGRAYVGMHGMKINTDDERLFSTTTPAHIKHSSGFGGEFGYRLTESGEIRFAYTDLNLVKSPGTFNTESGANIGLNYLYFPTKQNFYVMGGASSLDVIDTEISANVGAGYRHYIGERSAIYIEANGHYQFDNNHKDMSAQLGFIYFFGDAKHYTAKKVVRNQSIESKPMPAATKVIAGPVASMSVESMPLDSDKDGVIDSKDNCNTTPMNDKVDNDGCTVFTQENDELNLHVNFDNAKAVVKAEYFNDIKVAADFLVKYPHVSLAINGHTSSQGNAAYNKSLSQQRAQAIVNVLTTQFGIVAERLTAQGFGEEQLLNSANTAKAHRENRRIEAKVMVTKKVAIKK